MMAGGFGRGKPLCLPAFKGKGMARKGAKDAKKDKDIRKGTEV